MNTSVSTAVPTDWVDAAPFRAHLRHLAAASGLPGHLVALECGVSPRLALALAHGRRGRPLRRIPRIEANRILRMDVAQLQERCAVLVPSGPTAHRLRALVGHGVSPAQLAAGLGCPIGAVLSLTEADAPPATVPHAWALRALAWSESLDRTLTARAHAA